MNSDLVAQSVKNKHDVGSIPSLLVHPPITLFLHCSCQTYHCCWPKKTPIYLSLPRFSQLAADFQYLNLDTKDRITSLNSQSAVVNSVFLLVQTRCVVGIATRLNSSCLLAKSLAFGDNLTTLAAQSSICLLRKVQPFVVLHLKSPLFWGLLLWFSGRTSPW